MARQAHATPEAAQEASVEWTDAVLECRTYGHQWRPSTAAYTKDRQGIATTQVCVRCTALRRALLDARSGWVLNTHIEYPDGYLTKGIGRITGDARGALRLETVVRSYGLRAVRRGA